ncbi:hypothetical protein [Nocardioides sp. 503]|uniref:hypothetical protein n=1 Tax=Nocardioides sp. 503 TaxID=2508326 RepID=UPI00106F224D|nr:hypothetical protein [Nocardioides sp. 503]
MNRLPLLALLPLVLALGACTGDADDGDDLPRADVGDVIQQPGGRVEGRHTFVVLPSGRYDFTVSTPRERTDTFAAKDAGVSAEAGEDRRFVEVEWERGVVAGDAFVMQAPEDVSPMLTVTAGGERYPLGALDEEGVYAAAVVVPEEAGDDIGLEVEYDGLTQVIRDAYDSAVTRADGPEELYFESPGQRWAACPETSLSGGDPAVDFFGADCRANITSPLPYFGPKGWAPEGRAWVVVRFDAGSPRTGYDGPGGYVDYSVRPSEVRLSIEGAEAPELFPYEEGEPVGQQDDGSWEALAVFSVPKTRDVTVRFRRVVVATPEDPSDAAAAGAPQQIRRVHAGSL